MPQYRPKGFAISPTKESQVRLHSDWSRQSSNLSYSDTCTSLCTEIDAQKEGVLSTNLHKIETFAKLELKKLTDSLPTTLENALKDFSRLSIDIVTATIEQLDVELIAAYKGKISDYDSEALPGGYSETYKRAFVTAAANARQGVSLAWKNWLVRTDNNHIELLRTSLQKLNESTEVGNESKWERGAQEALDENTRKYNDVITVEYLWENPQAVKETYKKKAQSAKDFAKCQFEGNEAEVKEKIEAELSKYLIYTNKRVMAKSLMHFISLENQLAAYQRQLDDALSPKEDPGSYKDITDSSTFRNNFIRYLKTQDIKESLSKDYLDKFDNEVSAKKSQFRQSYNNGLFPANRPFL